MLSTTGPLIQSWWAREQHDPQLAQRAYRLFALSNAGSLLGLVSYPFIIEPYVSTQHQAWVWSTAYAVFTVLVILVGLRAMRRPMALTPSEGVQTGTEESTHRISLQDHLFWFCMAGLATLLLLAISSHITQNVASIPFLWILPLSLYLLTFVLAFEGSAAVAGNRRETFMLPALAVSAIMAWGLVADDGIMRIQEAIPLYLGASFWSASFAMVNWRSPSRRAQAHPVLLHGGPRRGLWWPHGLLACAQLAPFYWELPAGLLAVALMRCGSYHDRPTPYFQPACSLWPAQWPA